MKSSGQPQQITTQKTNQEPWSAQQPFLEQGFEAAQGLYNDPKEFFPGQTYVSPTASDIGSLDATRQRATEGSPITGEAQQQYRDTIGGKFLGAGNPAYDAMVERSVQPLRREFEETVKPNIQGQFSLAGRGGSNMQSAFRESAANQDYMRAVGDQAASLAYPSYEAERGRMVGQLGNAGAMAGMDYTDPAMLAGVGEAERSFLQQPLNQQLAEYNFAQNEPADRLAQYMGLIGGGYGSSGSTTNIGPQTYSNPLLGMLGGGAMGAQAGNFFGAPGWGALGGGLLGALGV